MNNPGVLYGILAFLVFIAVYVWTALSLSAVFRKAGEEAWKAWVPFLNVYVLLELGGFSGWFVLLLLVPVVGQLALFVVLIMAYHRINTAFGLGVGMTVLAALLLPVWASIVGWGAASWQGSAPQPGPVRQGSGPTLDTRLEAAHSAPAVPPAAAFAPPAPRAVPLAPVAASAPPMPVSAAPAAPATPAVPPPIGAVPVARPVDSPAPPVSFAAPVRTPALPDQAYPPAPATRAEARAAAADAPPTEPVQRVPPAPEPTAGEPWAPPTSSTSSPAIASRATRYSPPQLDTYVESSTEVSAVAGAPVLGSPRAAGAAVSAQHAALEDEDDLDATVLAVRRRPTWELVLPDGETVVLTSDVVVIGRRPVAGVAHPDAQLVSVADETRTMSKTHARLELRGDVWHIIDLDSTNGVLVNGEDGAEQEIPPGTPQQVDGMFLLGDAELRIGTRPA